MPQTNCLKFKTLMSGIKKKFRNSNHELFDYIYNNIKPEESFDTITFTEKGFFIYNKNVFFTPYDDIMLLEKSEDENYFFVAFRFPPRFVAVQNVYAHVIFKINKDGHKDGPYYDSMSVLSERIMEYVIDSIYDKLLKHTSINNEGYS